MEELQNSQNTIQNFEQDAMTTGREVEQELNSFQKLLVNYQSKV